MRIATTIAAQINISKGMVNISLAIFCDVPTRIDPPSQSKAAASVAAKAMNLRRRRDLRGRGSLATRITLAFIGLGKSLSWIVWSEVGTMAFRPVWDDGHGTHAVAFSALKGCFNYQNKSIHYTRPSIYKSVAATSRGLLIGSGRR
jgi:hypothetical protein